jgi:hypothetical protein
VKKYKIGILAEKWSMVVVVIILIIGAALRVFLYGDLRLSIGTNDSSSYIYSSHVPLFSWEMFTGARLFTTNLVYKLASDQGCNPPIISSPAEGKEEFRVIQPCFDKIAILQNVLSILLWCVFAWVFSIKLNNHFAKILSAITILVFAFVPQIAEWDSILGSESLTFSLFALSLALLLEILFRFAKEGVQIQSGTKIWIAIYLIVFSLWVLVRDVNLSAVVITLGMIMILLFFEPFRHTRYLFVISFILISLLPIGIISTRQSPRLTLTLGHSFEQRIFPYPARVEFFKSFGMPELSSPTYEDWHKKKASTVYMLFLLSHPRFVVQTMFEYISYFTDAHLQPYYISPELPYRDVLITIGEFLHSKTSAVYLLDTIFVITLCLAAIKHRQPHLYAWSWFATWIYLVSGVSLFLNFFGDVSGSLRHIFPAVATFRLSVWLFMLILVDNMLDQKEKDCVVNEQVA